jgi:transposase
MHRMVNKMMLVGDRKRPLIIHAGDASFGCGGKGEISVPVKQLVNETKQSFRRLKRRGEMVKADEYMTSQGCFDCRSRLSKVFIEGQTTKNGRPLENLDIKRCEHGCCSNPNVSVIKDRDYNAACNILLLLVWKLSGHPDRPEYLSRKKLKKVSLPRKRKTDGASTSRRTKKTK